VVNLSTSKLAIAALVVSIIGLILSILPLLGLPLPIIAVVLGFVALYLIKRDKLEGKGIAIAGLIIGLVGLAVQILVVGGLALLVGYVMNNNICAADGTFDCETATVTEDSISFSLTNKGTDEVTVMKLTGITGSDCKGMMQVSQTLPPGATGQFTFTSQQAFDGFANCQLSMEYQQGGVTEITNLQLSGKVEP
jgi:hypothetical protein